MMQPKQSLAILILASTLTGCDIKDWDATGYADGYDATVNANCGREPPLVDGRYDRFQYTQGYARGAKSAADNVQSKGGTNLANP
jgi:hypothetical protein